MPFSLKRCICPFISSHRHSKSASKGAQYLLLRAETFSDLVDATKDCDLSVAFTRWIPSSRSIPSYDLPSLMRHPIMQVCGLCQQLLRFKISVLCLWTILPLFFIIDAYCSQALIRWPVDKSEKTSEKSPEGREEYPPESAITLSVKNFEAYWKIAREP
jgi:hypothetical protein